MKRHLHKAAIEDTVVVEAVNLSDEVKNYAGSRREGSRPLLGETAEAADLCQPGGSRWKVPHRRQSRILRPRAHEEGIRGQTRKDTAASFEEGTLSLAQDAGRIRPIASAAHPTGIHQATGQLQLHRPAREPRADGQPWHRQDAPDDGARHKGLPAWLQSAVRQCSDAGKRVERGS